MLHERAGRTRGVPCKHPVRPWHACHPLAALVTPSRPSVRGFSSRVGRQLSGPTAVSRSGGTRRRRPRTGDTPRGRPRSGGTPRAGLRSGGTPRGGYRLGAEDEPLGVARLVLPRRAVHAEDGLPKVPRRVVHRRDRSAPGSARRTTHSAPRRVVHAEDGRRAWSPTVAKDDPRSAQRTTRLARLVLPRRVVQRRDRSATGAARRTTHPAPHRAG